MLLRQTLWLGIWVWMTVVGMAEPPVLWRVGTPDNDYRDFALAGRLAEYLRRFPQSVLFRVGQSQPEQDWSFIQPGPADAWAGLRRHPFRIEFDLSAVPAGTCRLTVDLVNTHWGQPPLLEVNVNDRMRYRFQLPAGADDRSLTDPRAGREFVLAFPFPSRHLQTGRNHITLTVLSGSWLLYDALYLEGGLPMPQEPEVSSLEASSTMFFRRVNGQLKQAVRVTLNNTGIEGDAEVRLTGVREQSQPVALVPGSNTFSLLVTPFERVERLRLSVRAGSKDRHVEFEGRPERRWKVFVAPSSHTDIGYTDWQERVFSRHNENTATALQACDKHPLFKWNLEVAFQAFLLRQHDRRAFAVLMEQVRKGRTGLQGLYLNMLTGLCSGEELVQALARAQRLGREHGFRVESANLTDVPTSVGTLPMLLSQAGIRYFAEAVNQHRAPVFRDADQRLQQSPFWWEGLDGSRVLAILTHSYAQASALGLTHSVEQTAQRLPNWLKGFDRKDYPCDAAYAYGAFSDNERLDPHYAEVVEEWNRQWEYPKIILARVDEFFRYVEGNFARSLPVLCGDLGVYWEDGAASSAHETALARWAKARLQAAERWHALTAVHRKKQTFPAEAIQSAWEEVLFYDEHTWGAWCSISDPESEQTKHQWAFKAAYAQRAAEKAETLDRSAKEALHRLLNPQAGQTVSPRAVTVLNEHSWARDMPVSVRVPEGEQDLRVRAAGSGRFLPAQRQKGRLLFRAERVPPLGYRCYLIERGEPKPEPPLLRAGTDAWTWETPDYRLRFDPGTGAVVSLTDRRLRREWVETASGYGLNQFLYVLGGEGTRLIHPHLAEPKLQVYSHTETRIRLVENGAVRAVLHLERRGTQTPPTDTFVIFQRNGRLDFVNLLHKEATTAKEAGYFAFPFRLSRHEPARAFVELPYGVLRVEQEQLPGGCREWYATHSFAAVSDGYATAYLATPHAPLLTVGDFFKGLWRGKIEKVGGSLFAYVLNNYWDTNYKASQGGDMVFAFSLRLRSGGFDPAEATRFGWESLSAMVDPRRGSEQEGWSECGVQSVECGMNDPNPKPEIRNRQARNPQLSPEGSFLRVAPDSVLVGGVTWDDDRLLVRLYNPAGRQAQATLTLPGLRVTEACRTNLVGVPQGRLATRKHGADSVLKVTVPSRGLTTLAIKVP